MYGQGRIYTVHFAWACADTHVPGHPGGGTRTTLGDRFSLSTLWVSSVELSLGGKHSQPLNLLVALRV